MPITITMPALSPTMTEGTLAKWLVSEGDNIAPGDVIAEIETDKATMEVEAIDEGTVGKLLIAEGTEGIAVNTPIAVVLEEGEDASLAASAAPAATLLAPKAAAAPAQAAPPTVPAPAASSGNGAAQGAAPPAPVSATGERVKASPLARRMAAQAGIELVALSGSGPQGRIVKVDVEAAISGGVPTVTAPAPAAAAPVSGAAQPFEAAFDLVPATTMRKTIARRLTESKQTVPHFYLTVDCEIDALLALRKDLNARSDGEFKLSVNDLVIKAAAVALMRVPAANASWTSDGIKFFKSADISVAVSTEGGLITPVIRRAEQRGLEDISRDMKGLAEKARDGKLMPEDYQGGTFSISNLGMYGVKHFEAVINPPQACILAVGAGEQRPVVTDGALAVATVMSCTLSVDHRAVDGTVGAQYLAALKKLIEDPLTMLL